ncbi:hypothetical protein CIRMBP1257_00534 [Enterococcus cecorum]|nr:hypothetical protein CIRMBP1257_00534 [Enterococcus cecorum]
MLNLTAEAKKAWLAQTRQVNARVTIGTAVYNADKIMSIEYDSGSISGETFQIGSFYQNSIKVVLVGILESLATDNKVRLEFAVKVGQAFEWVNMGTFYVTELDRDRNSNRTTFTAVDASVYLGKNYAPTISFPNSLKNLVTDIANQCGVQVNFASMTHLADVNVTQPPSKYTCRQVISMVAQIHGGFARINRNDQLEVTRLMSSDIELSPSHYLLKGLTKNETTYRTDGIIVKIGENEEDVLKVGTTTGSAVINLENPLMTQTLLDEMWRVVSIISYYPFNLKWRGIPNLEAGDWITIVDKQGTRYRVPNLSYKLSFKGGLSAESSANTTATSNVQHKLRGTLTQRVEDVEGYINATGGRSYTGLDVPDNKYLKKGDTWYKPDGDDTAILVYDGEKWEEVASPEVFRQLQADFDELDRQAKEAFEQVDTLVQESPETKRLAQEAQEAVNLANKEITKLQTSVSDTKTALQNAEQEFADSLETTTRELTAKISGIDVGGRNILRGTKDMKLGSGTWESGTWRKSNTGTFRNVTLTDFPLSNITQGIEITSDNSECGIAQDYLKLESGEYTLSYYVKAKTSGTEVWVQSFWNGEYNSETKHIVLNNTEWNRISVTGNLPVNQDNISAGYIYVETPNATITVAAPFEHRSNKEGEWNQAPEDFESDLSNTSIELSTKITESAAKLRTEMSEKYSTKNDLTTLQGEYNSFKEETAKKISQQVSSIETVQTNTTEAQKLAGEAYNKAQSATTSATNASSTANSALDKASNATNVANSASQNATNAVANANSAVSAANTAKSNADKAIADVAALTKTVSSQSTRIDQTSSRIDLVANSVTEVGDKLDNLQVGSRNLWIINKTTGGTKETLPDNHITGQKECWRINNNEVIQFLIEPSFSKRMYGKTFTFSAWIKYENVVQGTDGWNKFDIFKHALQYKNSSSGTITGIDFSSLGSATGTHDWQKVIYTSTYDKSGFDMLKNSLRFNIEGAKSGTAWITGIKVEEGNKATDWTPAPEDTQTQIDGINNNLSNNYYQKTDVDSKLSTTVNGITAQYKQDITTKLGNYYDKSTIDSKLTIDGKGIATYVKSTQSQLDGLQICGENLIKNTNTDKMSITWAMQTGGYERTYYKDNGVIVAKLKRDNVQQTGWSVICVNGIVLDKLKPNTKYIVSFEIQPTASTSLQFVLRRGNGADTASNQYSMNYSVPPNQWSKITFMLTTTNPLPNLSDQVIYITGMNSAPGTEYHFRNFKMAEGNKETPWSPAPEDMATLTQYTEVKQLADRISSTVYDSSTGLVTKTTQLAGKYAIQNLNSYGDVLSSLNLNGGNVRIKGGLIDLDGNVRIQDGFVNNLKANSILANEITAKATTVVNAKIANLDAGVITTGILKGTNLSLNLGTGEVQFQKGRIQAPNNTLDIQVNTGIMKVLNTNGEGVTFQNGNLYFSNANEQSYFGSLIYNNQLFSNSFKGVSLIGKNAFQIKTSNYTDFALSYTKQIGAGISASPNGMILQSDKRINIIGGQPSGGLTTPAMVSIGTKHGSYSGNGNGVTIDGYSDGIYLSVANGGKISMFGDVEFITGTITGPLVKSTDFSVKNMTFKFSTNGSYIEVETSFGKFKIPVSS